MNDQLLNSETTPVINEVNTVKTENMTTGTAPTVELKKRTRRTKAEMELARSKGEVISVEEETEVDNQEEEETVPAVKRTDRYVYSEKTVEVLEVAYVTNKNVVLWGPGGYSKSTLSLDFMRDKGHEPFVVTMGKGMTLDRLYGGLDLKKFQEDGRIEYLVENSFMNHEYVIFEELFDSPDYILEQLKDTLSSKILRNGGQVFPLKTKFIICNTNQTREFFTKNNSSLLALMERFPLELEVRWKDHNRITYENLLNKVNGFADPMLTYVLEEFAKAGHTISPRIAIEAAQVLDACGPNCFEYIADFATQRDLLKKALTKYKSIEELMMFEGVIADYSKTMEGLNLDEKTGKEIREIITYHTNFSKALNKVKKVAVDDTLSDKKVGLVKEGENKYNTYAKVINSYTTSNGVPLDDKGNPLTTPVEIDELLKDIEL